MDLFNGKLQRYYGETDADFRNRITYEFMNREPENNTVPGEAIIIYTEPAPNTYVEYVDNIPLICSKRIVQIDCKNPVASYLAAERMIPHGTFLGNIRWCGYYPGIGWRNMVAFRSGKELKITVKEDK